MAEQNFLETAFNTYFGFLNRWVIKPLRRIAGDSSKAQGPALFILALRHLIVAAILFMMFAGFVGAMSFLGIETDTLLGEVSGYLVGCPLIFGMGMVCLEIYRLLVIGAAGGTGSDELDGFTRYFGLFVGVLMFVGGLFLMFNFNFWLSSKFGESQEHKKFLKEQQEYLAIIDQGSAAWNKYINSTPMHWITLAGLKLDGKDFSDYDLHRVKFQRASLKKAKFDRSNLLFAKFDEADCSEASFQKAYMLGTSFEKTRLDRANFSGAFIEQKELVSASKSGIILTGASENFSESAWRK